jgi:hypothetical protein
MILAGGRSKKRGYFSYEQYAHVDFDDFGTWIRLAGEGKLK